MIAKSGPMACSGKKCDSAATPSCRSLLRRGTRCALHFAAVQASRCEHTAQAASRGPFSAARAKHVFGGKNDAYLRFVENIVDEGWPVDPACALPSDVKAALEWASERSVHQA